MLAVPSIPADLEQQPDPYRWLEKMREAGPVQRVDLRGGLHGWIVTRYDEVMTALSDPRLSSSPQRAAGAFEAAGRGWQVDDSALGRSMLVSDPPDHTRLRRLVSRAFTVRRIELLRPRV